MRNVRRLLGWKEVAKNEPLSLCTWELSQQYLYGEEDYYLLPGMALTAHVQVAGAVSREEQSRRIVNDSN